MVGSKRADQAEKRGTIEQKSINFDSVYWVAGQLNVNFAREQREEKHRYARGNVMPVECPNILNRNRIGKHGSVSIKCQLIVKCDHYKCDRPGEADSDYQCLQ